LPKGEARSETAWSTGAAREAAEKARIAVMVEDFILNVICVGRDDFEY
jgi:hypothetical protein